MAETRDLPLKAIGVSSVIELNLNDPLVFVIMKALSSTTRLRILKILKKRLDICQIARELNQTEANISAQIKILEKSHLIVPKYETGRRGIKKICEPNIERIIINI